MLNAWWCGSIKARRVSAEAGNFFFQPVEFHVEPADLLEELGFARLLGRVLLGLIARLEKAGRAGEQLLLPNLNLGRMHIEKHAELLGRFLPLVRRNGALGLELGAAALLLAGHDSLL